MIVEVEYFLAHAPADTPLPAIITAAGLRWNIEDDTNVVKINSGWISTKFVNGPPGTGT